MLRISKRSKVKELGRIGGLGEEGTGIGDGSLGNRIGVLICC